MHERLNNIFHGLTQSLTLGLVVAIPLFFWQSTTEFYETPKLLILFIGVAALLLIWALRSLFFGRVVITRTPLDLPFLLLVAVMVVSVFFLPPNSRVAALIGNLPRVNGGVVSFLLYILLYFLLVANLKSVVTIRRMAFALVGVATTLAVWSLMAYFGIDLLPLQFTQALNFTPTGSSFSTSAIIALTIPFLLMAVISRDMEGGKLDSAASGMVKLFSALLLSLFGVVVVLVGSLPAFAAAITSYLLVLFIATPEQLKKNAAYLFTPLLIAVATALFSFVQLAPGNPLYAQAQKFPREIQLPFNTSWTVSVSAFRDSPFYGTGPASYLPDFTFYKPVEFNLTPYWNIRFDQAYNEYLQLLATLGATGLIALLLLSVLFISLAFKTFGTSGNGLGKAAALSGVAFFVLLLFHASTLVVWVMGILILAMFMAASKDVTEELHIGIAAAKRSERELQLRFDALPMIFLLIVAGLIIGASYFVIRFTLADYHHRQALNAVAGNQAKRAYDELVMAEQFNMYTDLYHLDLAQTNFALANAIAATKGPTEASPSGSLTNQDKTAIQTFLTQSINEGKAAVAINPRSPVNWEVLGSIYRQISGVAQNALTFSVDAYGRAIQRDPVNPLLRLTYGGIYYQVKNYDMAVKYFTDAVTVKPDYTNGYYNLAVALRDKGNLREAKLAAERTVTLLQSNTESQDYQTASNLLKEISDLVASQAAQQQATIKTPGEESALQNRNLPKVLDLPKKEDIATPPAVPTRTATPTLTPTITLTP